MGSAIYILLLPAKQRCGGLCLYPNRFLYAVGSSAWGIDWATHILDECARGIVVTGATAYIRLL